MTAATSGSSGTMMGTFLPPTSAEWFLRGATPETLTSDFVIRSLRRRLWKAFQEDDAEVALRAYQATTHDLERWLEEEDVERISLLQQLDLHGGGEKNSSLRDGRRRALLQRTAAAGPVPALSYQASFYHVKLEHMQGPVLQSQMNPSEPFIADDFLSPYDLESYEFPPRKDLPKYDPLSQPTNLPRKDRGARFTLFQLFRKQPAEPAVVIWDEDLNRRHTQVNQAMLVTATQPPPAGATTATATTATTTNATSTPLSASDQLATFEVPTMTTPLHEAARIGAGDFIRVLLAHGGDPNIKNGTARTALHMASGGLTRDERQAVQLALNKKKATRKKGKKKKTPNASLGISTPAIPQQALAVMHEELYKTKKVKSTNAQKAAKAVGRFVKSALGTSKEKPPPLLSLPTNKRSRKSKVDSDKCKHLTNERVDAVLAVLAWFHSETGDGPSINAVDADGRTALHYAAELGRAEICMAILSNFGAMLTIIDDVGARTPCELAAENGHKKLASQLEARALLYIDPYGVDDELLATMLQMENHRTRNRRDDKHSKLVPPFCWFQTMYLDRVENERLERIETTREELLKVVQAWDVAAMNAQETKPSVARKVPKTRQPTDQTNSALNGLFAFATSLNPDDMHACGEELSSCMSSEGESQLSEDEEEEDTKPPAKVNLGQEEDGKVGSYAGLQEAFLSLQESHIERFLMHHQWKVADAIKAFKSNPKQAFVTAGITLPAPPPNDVNTTDRTCLICYDDPVDEEEWVPLSGCVHGFCADCLKGYLKDCASTKMGMSSITCPHHECEVPLTSREINDLLNDQPDDAARIQEATQEQFVTAAHDFKFCNHPGCPGIVHRLSAPFLSKHGIDEALVDYAGAVCTATNAIPSTSSNQDESEYPLTYEGVEDEGYHNAWSTVQPRKAHRFCFACGEKPHWPISCKKLEEWKQKVEEEVGTVEDSGSNDKSSDLAQKLWIKTNTRPCPKCNVPIEKDDGCNHMTCTNPACRHEFCWICRKDWKLHGTATGGFFRCNIWQEDQPTPDGTKPSPPASELDNLPDEQGYGTAIHSAREAFRVRQEMARFLHHYTRYEAHGESSTLEQNMADTVCTRLASVVGAAAEFDGSPEFNFGGKGLSFVHAAFTELQECRSVLRYSYAFSFFRYPSMHNFRRYAQLNNRRREKVTFERIQSELETLTEQMSDIVARAHLRATQVQISFLTASAAEKREDLSNLIFSILHEESKESASKAKAKVKATQPATAMLAGHSVFGRPRDNDSDTSDDAPMTSADLNEILARMMPMGYETEQPPPPVSMWECTACTYMNGRDRHCAMCGTLRRGQH